MCLSEAKQFIFSDTEYVVKYFWGCASVMASGA